MTLQLEYSTPSNFSLETEFMCHENTSKGIQEFKNGARDGAGA